jgi:hypothetical protein
MKRHLANIAFMATALSVALGSYLVSARVAAERAAVEGLKGAIQADMEDMQGLEAELRIRSRLPQLERWNREVLALQAPQAGQFARDSLHLAALVQPVLPAGDAATAVQSARTVTVAGAHAEVAAAAPAVRAAAYAASAAATGEAAAPPPVMAAPRLPAPSRPGAPTLIASAVLPASASAAPILLAPVEASDVGLAITAELERLPPPSVPAGQ